MPDYIPDSDAQLATWLKNYGSKLPNHKAALGIPDATIKAGQGSAAAITAAIEKNEQKRTEYQAQVAATNATKTGELASIRALNRLIKAQPGYTESIGRDLGIVAGLNSLAAETAKPTLRADAQPGLVRLRFSKEGFAGVNLYRERTDGGWEFLGRDTQSPFEDRAPLAAAGQPEVRRYRAVYLHKDSEVGEPSDVVQVTFSG
ncbi:MAG: hypothetical protein U1A78_11780 [Polyangia bacterium]